VTASIAACPQSYVGGVRLGPWQLAEELRGRVREATGGLTCSAGVGANRLLAKV